MKESGKHNKNDKIYKNYVLKQASMLIQFVLAFFALVFVILSLVNPAYSKAVTLTTGLVLLVMGYNNYKIYKRKSFTAIYILIGVIVLVFGIIELIK